MQVRGIERFALPGEKLKVGDSVGILLGSAVDREELKRGMEEGTKYYLRLRTYTVGEVRQAKAALLRMMK